MNDVSALGGVHTLNLSFCKGIEDVSALGNVHTLILNWCMNVTDVSTLGGVHTLDIRNIPVIESIRELENVPNLSK